MTRRSGPARPASPARLAGQRRRSSQKRTPVSLALGHAADPFALLGLDPDADLTDDEIRTAWRRIAAASHPDRADGGDPGRFAAAAAAYTELRTKSGRGEARASLAAVAAAGRAGRAAGETPAAGTGPAARMLTRVRLGRPVRLALRVLGAAGAGAAGLLAAGPGPAGPALAAGALTWLVLTIRRDLNLP